MSVRFKEAPERTLYLTAGFFKSILGFDKIKQIDSVSLIIRYSSQCIENEIKVLDAQTVFIKTNCNTHYEDIVAYMKQQTDFITYRLTLHSEMKVTQRSIPQFKHNETIFLFDRPYVVQKSLKTYRSYIEDNKIIISALNDKKEGLFEAIQDVAQQYMSELTAALADLYGFTYRAVRIYESTTAWGSCNSDGIIHYNISLAFLPLAFTEYVSIHELSHTRQMNHGPDFWREVRDILPCYEVMQELGRGYHAKNYHIAMR